MRYFIPAKTLKYAVYLLLLWITFASCSKRKVVIYDEQGRVAERYTIIKNDSSMKTGKYYAFYPDGQEKEFARYKKGKLHGVRILSHPNGMPMQEEYYENGIYHGSFRSRFEDGKMKAAGFYEDGKMTGLWKFYYNQPRGQIKEEVTFSNNAENGPFREYHPNGELAAEGVYVNELEHGLVRIYNENGILIKEIEYNQGRPVKYTELPLPE
jgi:antitoxin component YwqK of YwqJK toxin-antitoxin module